MKTHTSLYVYTCEDPNWHLTFTLTITTKCLTLTLTWTWALWRSQGEDQPKCPQSQGRKLKLVLTEIDVQIHTHTASFVFPTSKQVLVWAPLLTVCLIRDWSCRSWASRDLNSRNNKCLQQLLAVINKTWNSASSSERHGETNGDAWWTNSAFSSFSCLHLHHKEPTTGKFPFFLPVFLH